LPGVFFIWGILHGYDYGTSEIWTTRGRTFDIDTMENFIEMDHSVDMGGVESGHSYSVRDAFSIKGDELKYNSYIGVRGSNSVNWLEADKATGVVTKAVVDTGPNYDSYGVNEKGEIVGDYKAAEKSVQDFSETVSRVKSKLALKQGN